MSLEDYAKWLREEKPTPEEIKERWAKIGIVIPFKRWKEICEFHDGLQTWDTLVECELEEKESEVVCVLGYYGHTVKASHARPLYTGKLWDESHYTVVYAGIDGSVERPFETIEHVREYVKGYVGAGCWTTSDTCWRNEFGRFTCYGFKLSDLDINWQEHVA